MKKIGIASGKGGVGKTTIAISLALSFTSYGSGLVDADITGSNVPDVLGYSELKVKDDRILPAEVNGVKYVSIGQIASRDLPVMWSGKDLVAAAKQLIEKTDWGNVNYLFVDLPPGSDEINQKLFPLLDYVVFVKIPSSLSESKVRRMIEMARETQTPILGLVKNFTYFECNGEKVKVFPDDGDYGLPVLLDLPISPEVAKKKIINVDPQIFLKAMEHPVLLQKRDNPLRGLAKTLLKAMSNGNI
mgnify:FL=1